MSERGFLSDGVFLASPEAVIVIDHDGIVRDWNPAAQTLFGYPRDEVLGRELAEMIVPPPLRDAHRAGLSRYLETGEIRLLNRRVELSAVAKDGTELVVELIVAQLPDVDPPVFAGFARSVATRGAAEDDNARLHERMGFLAQAGLALDRSLDYNETLRSLADLIVPDLAQLAVIDVLTERGTIELTVAASEAPHRARELEEVRAHTGLLLSSGHPVATVLRSGRPMLLATMTGAFLSAISQSEEHLELMRSMGYHSAIVVPLVARSRTLGALSLLRMEGAPSYGDSDLVLAEELARRAALAVDNARLFESTRQLARTLQQSLLPHSLPEIPGVRLTGRYRAADSGDQVGGDFYDAFTLDENRWGVTIGDVCGKGAEAAALTAFARYTIRAFADADPSLVLSRLNESVIRERDTEEGRFLTALFATVTIEPGHLQVDAAVGGHPAPLVIRSDGRVESVDVGGPMIGVDADAEFPTTRVLLHRGDTIVLYTDGLTDAQAPDRILTDEDLIELVRSAGGMAGERLAEFMEARASDGRDVRDDIALLVIEYP